MALLAGCSSSPDQEPSPDHAPVAPGWWQQTAWTAGTKLGGCAIGDFDPAHAGSEIAVVAADGRVIALRRDGDGWAHELVAELPGEPIQCAIGDCRPDLPGDELVAVGALEGGEDGGGPGAYSVFARIGGEWRRVEHGTQPALIHAVAIGDVDASTPGQELVLAGFARQVAISTVVESGSGSWERRALAGTESLALPGNAKGAAVGMVGAVIACDDGSLMRVHADESGWTIHAIGSWPGAGLARVTADGEGALVCANDGVLRYRRWMADGAVTMTDRALRAKDRLRGAVIADVAPQSDGLEFATAGYDGVVYVIHVSHLVGGVLGTTPFVVARDDDKFHHLAAGELPGLGMCLVAVGYSGRVIVVGNEGS